MKKILLYLIMITSVSKAQDSISTFGIKGSMDIAKLYGKDIANLSDNGYQQNLTGEVIAIYLNNKLSKHFWLKHELSLARRFLNITMKDGTNTPFPSNIKRQYLDVYPANATFHYKGFQVYAGTYIGILLNGSIQRKDTAGVLYKDRTFSSDKSNSTIHANKLDAGFVVGIEYEFKMGLNFGAHYIQGLVPLILQNKIFNQYYGLSLGYSFVR